MKEKKELKKLNLEKEEIINLNEYEMEAVKGGSTYKCYIETAISAIGLTIETYKLGKEESWWRCATPEPTPTPTPTPTGGNCGCGCGCTLAPNTFWEL